MPRMKVTDRSRKRRLVLNALEAQRRGRRLTREQKRALSRYRACQEERLRWKHYRTISKKHWCKMSGRQVKVINEQADRYGLPLRGGTINLPEFVRAFHDFLAQNAKALSRKADGGIVMQADEELPPLDWLVARLDVE